MSPRIFVDAKILNRHDKTTPKKTLVAYSAKDESISGVHFAPAEVTDDAELHAVAFAIRDLKDKFPEFTIVSDHEPIVTEIKEKKKKSGQKRPVLLEILDEIDKNPNIKVELLENNPAHRVLNQYVRDHPEVEE